MIWLLGIGKWLREAATALFSLISRYPLQCAVIVLLCASLWLWRGKSHAENELTSTIAAYTAAQIEAEQLAIAARDKQEQQYKDKAHAADLKYTETLADAGDAAARFISSHRLRPQGQCAASKATTPAESGGAESAVGSGEGAFVAVADSDIHICTENTLRLKAAHDWAIGLGE